MTTPTSPGWQPAPDGNGEQWWNGVDWSESRRGHSTAQPPAPAYGPPVPDGYAPPVAPNPYAQPASVHVPPTANQYAPPVVSSPAQNLATTALILGIVGVFIWVAGVVAIVLGLQARTRLAAEGALPKYSSYATTGIVLGAVGIVFGLGSLVLGFFPLFFGALL